MRRNAIAKMNGRFAAAARGMVLALGFVTLAAGSRAAPPPLRPLRDRILTEANLAQQRGGSARHYELSLGEIATRGRDGRTTLSSVPVQANAEALRRWLGGTAATPGTERSLVLYEAGRPHTASTRRIVTREVVIALDDGVSPRDLAAKLGIDYVGRWTSPKVRMGERIN